MEQSTKKTFDKRNLFKPFKIYSDRHNATCCFSDVLTFVCVSAC